MNVSSPISSIVPGVGDALRDLVRQGIALRDHLAAPAVVALASLRQGMIDAVAQHVDRWEVPAEAVWLFGPTARGDGDAGSDDDLLVVRHLDVDEDDRRREAQLSAPSEAVHAWTGNPAGIVEHGSADLTALAASGDALVENLSRDAVAVTGPTLAALLGTARAA